MLRGYFADEAVNLAAMPAYRREHFPPAGPAPWLGAPDAEARISEKLRAHTITEDQAAWCRDFARDGLVVLEGFYSPAYIDEVWAAYEAAILAGTVVLQPEPAGPGDAHPGRSLNPHRAVPAIDAFLHDPKLKEVFDLLVGRDTVAFQTIAAHKGSEQAEHSDAIHMTTFPLGYMIAAWTAFEDMHADAGPLVYCPGSHRLPYALSREVGISAADFDRDGYETYRLRYEPYIQNLIREGLQTRTFMAKKGDVLVWHHNLIHGGSPRRNLALSRKSIVSHHFTQGAICYHDLSGHCADMYGLLQPPKQAGPTVYTAP